MNVKDKHGVLAGLKDRQSVSLELGCGNRKQVVAAIGVDQLDHPCVDLVGDVMAVLGHFPDASVDSVHSFHFFEHVADLSTLLKEINRILKKGGWLEVVVPHFSSPYFYSDFTHRVFFGLYSFDYFVAKTLFARKVPKYGEPLAFEVMRVDLVFKSPRPFYIRHVLKGVLGSLFNSCNYMRELYEENFCYLFPCYELRYELRRTDLAS